MVPLFVILSVGSAPALAPIQSVPPDCVTAPVTVIVLLKSAVPVVISNVPLELTVTAPVADKDAPVESVRVAEELIVSVVAEAVPERVTLPAFVLLTTTGPYAMALIT